MRWNEYKGPYLGLRFGGGILYDFAGFGQDRQSEQQVELEPTYKLRDFRVLLKGSFPALERTVTWSSGIMYDAPTSSWLVRETGVMIAVPELWGHLFIGRTKEGFSLNKVMVGFAGWTMERATINDATIPILADGIKWLGYVPDRKFLWNLGFYGDWLSEGQTFSTYDHQVVGRAAWLPILSEESGRLLHVGVNLRYGKADDGRLQLRSRPEAFPAPYFVDTGAFDATNARTAGYEVYSRRGPWLIGSEYWFQWVGSESTGDPVFRGGDAFVAWNITGETRVYNTVGGFFKQVSPKKPVFEGGPGGWELVLRFSDIDLDSGPLRGGKFRRLTPMVNWHLSDNVRLELAYGYGVLHRDDLAGGTHFFQARLQLQL